MSGWLKWILLFLPLMFQSSDSATNSGCDEVTSWAAVDICSVTCQNGVQTYQRTCCNQRNQGAGSQHGKCLNDYTENSTKSCFIDIVGNGGWSDWSSWSTCPVTCGGTSNNQNRIRTCTNPTPYCNGAACSGSSEEFQTCNSGCCPVDGAWIEWSASGICSLTCGGGIQSWTRSCTNPPPSCSGATCSGDNSKTTTCNTMCCPVDGAWSNWGTWQACPVTCGGTTNNQIRTRSCTNPATSCGGVECTVSSGQSDTDYTTCNEQCCPVDGGWALWEEWYACPVTCGGGTHNRYRDCSNPFISCGGALCPGCVGSLCNNGIQRDTGTGVCNDFDCENCGTREIGYGTPSTYTTTTGANTGFGILAESGFYTSPCCGVIKSWEFYASNSGELQLMIWRKSGSTYTLVGKNIYTVASNAVGHTIKYTIREVDRLTIKYNDMLGWYTPGVEIIPYSVSDPQNFRMTHMGSIDEGNTFNWGSYGFVHNRAYAIRVFTDYNTAPMFTNLHRELIISDDKAVGGYIYKVQYFQGDTRDNIIWAYTTSNSNISFDTQTEMIYLKATPSVGTYTMTFSITDSCVNTASGTLTIKVFNTPLRITSLPNFVNINEDVTEGQLIYSLTIYDRQATDTIKCVLTTVTPSTAFFTVHNIHLTSDYGVYLQPNAAFDYNTNKMYELLISCEDGKNTAVTGYFFVYIQKNHPPRFLNIPASLDLTVTTTLMGDLVYTVQMTDDESNTLKFSMTTEPNNGPFIIKDYGDILTTDDLSNIFTPAYNIKVSVNDGRTTVGTRTLSVHLTNINDVPLISSLPLPHAFMVEENSPIGTSLYRVRVRDLDIADTLLLYGYFSPNTGSTYFYLKTDGFLTISSSLDYESIVNTSFKIVVTADDGKDTASATLSITVTDENEAPTFHQTEYSVEQIESTQFTAFPSAEFSIYDPDVAEYWTYWLDCGNDTWRFIMNTTTGQISYAYNYDLDKVLIKQFNCMVRAKDTGFNTCAASLIIKIKDINNPPYFNETQFVFYITPYEEVGAFIGNVTAYDIDISEYGTFTYKLDMTSYDALYVQIYDNGTLYINTPLSSKFQHRDVMKFNLSAIDYGGLETTVTVWIVFAEKNTDDTSTTPSPKTFLASSKNIAWVTAVGILTLIIMLCILYHCSKYWIPIDCLRTSIVKSINKSTKDETKKDNDKEVYNANKKGTLTSQSTQPMESIDIKRLPGNPLFSKDSNSAEKYDARKSVVSLKSINMSQAFTVITSSRELVKSNINQKRDQIIFGQNKDLYKFKDRTSLLEASTSSSMEF